MANRRKTRRGKDKKVFVRTAKRTKQVNLGVLNYRGGIRL